MSNRGFRKNILYALFSTVCVNALHQKIDENSISFLNSNQKNTQEQELDSDLFNIMADQEPSSQSYQGQQLQSEVDKKISNSLIDISSEEIENMDQSQLEKLIQQVDQQSLNSDSFSTNSTIQKQVNYVDARNQPINAQQINISSQAESPIYQKKPQIKHPQTQQNNKIQNISSAQLKQQKMIVSKEKIQEQNSADFSQEQSSNTQLQQKNEDGQIDKIVKQLELIGISIPEGANKNDIDIQSLLQQALEMKDKLSIKPEIQEAKKKDQMPFEKIDQQKSEISQQLKSNITNFQQEIPEKNKNQILQQKNDSLPISQIKLDISEDEIKPLITLNEDIKVLEQEISEDQENVESLKNQLGVSKKILHNHALELKSKKQEALVYAENMNKQKLFIDGNSSLGEMNMNQTLNLAQYNSLFEQFGLNNIKLDNSNLAENEDQKLQQNLDNEISEEEEESEISEDGSQDEEGEEVEEEAQDDIEEQQDQTEEVDETVDKEQNDGSEDDPEQSICQCESNSGQPLILPEIQIIQNQSLSQILDNCTCTNKKGKTYKTTIDNLKNKVAVKTYVSLKKNVTQQKNKKVPSVKNNNTKVNKQKTQKKNTSKPAKKAVSKKAVHKNKTVKSKHVIKKQKKSPTKKTAPKKKKVTKKKVKKTAPKKPVKKAKTKKVQKKKSNKKKKPLKKKKKVVKKAKKSNKKKKVIKKKKVKKAQKKTVKPKGKKKVVLKSKKPVSKKKVIAKKPALKKNITKKKIIKKPIPKKAVIKKPAQKKVIQKKIIAKKPAPVKKVVAKKPAPVKKITQKKPAQKIVPKPIKKSVQEKKVITKPLIKKQTIQKPKIVKVQPVIKKQVVKSSPPVQKQTCIRNPDIPQNQTDPNCEDTIWDTYQEETEKIVDQQHALASQSSIQNSIQTNQIVSSNSQDTLESPIVVNQVQQQSNDPYFDEEFNQLDFNNELDFSMEEKQAATQPLRIRDMESIEDSLKQVATEVSSELKNLGSDEHQAWMEKKFFVNNALEQQLKNEESDYSDQFKDVNEQASNEADIQLSQKQNNIQVVSSSSQNVNNQTLSSIQGKIKGQIAKNIQSNIITK